MKKRSNGIRKRIQSLNDELDNLRERLAETDQKYSEVKANVNLDDPDTKEQLQSLKSEKDLVLELIEERQKKITALEDDLEVQVEKDKREQTLDQLIDLANEAEKLENEFHAKLEMLDSLLSEKIPKIIRIRQEWEKTAKEFMTLGDRTLGKGFCESTTYSKVKNGKEDELTDDILIEELERKGVNLKPVTSGRVLSSQHFTHISNARESELNFGENLFKMMRQSNIGELITKED